MLRRFTTKEIILIAVLAAFMFIIDFFIVAPINTITGVHGMGFLIDVIFINAIVTIFALITRKFFSVTILYTLFGLLVIPTSIMGPPTPFKIILGFIIGITADLIIWISKYKTIGFVFGVAVANALSYPIGLLFAILLGLPGVEALRDAILFLTIGVLLLGILGDIFGVWIFKKIKNKQIVKQLQS